MGVEGAVRLALRKELGADRRPEAEREQRVRELVANGSRRERRGQHGGALRDRRRHRSRRDARPDRRRRSPPRRRRRRDGAGTWSIPGEGARGGQLRIGRRSLRGVALPAGRRRSGDVPCVVMAQGFSLTRHDGLDHLRAPLRRGRARGARLRLPLPRRLRRRAAAALPQGDQLADWKRAIAFRAPAARASTASRIVLWGYSFGGGHVATIAPRDGGLAAAIVLAPYLNGLRRAVKVSPSVSAWILPRALADLAGRRVDGPGHRPRGLAGGDDASPGEEDGFAARRRRRARRGETRSRPARSRRSPFHRPLRNARRIDAPIWVGRGKPRHHRRRAVDRPLRRARRRRPSCTTTTATTSTRCSSRSPARSPRARSSSCAASASPKPKGSDPLGTRGAHHEPPPPPPEKPPPPPPPPEKPPPPPPLEERHRRDLGGEAGAEARRR